MKMLLTISAIIEGTVGLVLLIIPTVATSVLLGVPLDTPGGLVSGRLAGAALIGLAVACWRARTGERGSPSTGVVEAMLLYNFAAAVVLVYAGTSLELRSRFLWPTIVLHLGLGAWCLFNLWRNRRKSEA